MRWARTMGTLVVFGAIHSGCGIDLADTTEGLDQETWKGEGPMRPKTTRPKNAESGFG